MESKVSRRLKQPLAQEVIQYVFQPRLNREFPANFNILNQINLAHLLMLHEQGILDHDASVLLARAIVKMQQDGSAAIELDAAREEAYFNYEAHLIKLVGQNLGGRLHTARSRNDIGATVDRIRARDFAARIGLALISLARAALSQAEKFVDDVMPGYTHMQAAQPVTYGYYLSALTDAWSRDADRIIHVLEISDGSPLGSCALAGTSFPIDRDLTSSLLGFSKPMTNALDGVASRDFALELSATLSIMMITCSRMVQDFYIWSTPEFGYLSFPDRVASTSSIMPQKKNPAVLEYLRGKAGHLIGLTSAAFSTVKSTHFTHSGDSSRESTRSCWEACDEALRSLELMTLLVTAAEPASLAMLSRARQDFSTVTDLADLLVRKADISFRDAHHIIGEVVRNSLDQGIPANAITAQIINTVASGQLNREIALSQEDIEACLDPVRNVASRESYGGPSPRLVRDHIARQKSMLDGKAAIFNTSLQRAKDAQVSLQNRVRKLVASRPDIPVGI